jgi:LEA14-like dessication related protein
MSPKGEKIFLWSVFAGLAGVVVFGAYKVKQNFDLLRAAKINLVNVRLDTKDSGAWILTLIFSVINKSSIEVEVVGYNINVSLNNVKVANTKNSTAQVVKASTYSELAIPVTFNPKTIWLTFIDPKMWQGLLKGDTSNMGIDIKGVISVRHAGITINDLPIDYQVKLNDYLGGKTPDQPKS